MAPPLLFKRAARVCPLLWMCIDVNTTVGCCARWAFAGLRQLFAGLRLLFPHCLRFVARLEGDAKLVLGEVGEVKKKK